MNQDTAKGAFELLKGKAKHLWAELTDDDILKAEGSADKLYGMIQGRFGSTKDLIKDKIDKLKM